MIVYNTNGCKFLQQSGFVQYAEYTADTMQTRSHGMYVRLNVYVIRMAGTHLQHIK